MDLSGALQHLPRSIYKSCLSPPKKMAFLEGKKNPPQNMLSLKHQSAFARQAVIESQLNAAASGVRCQRHEQHLENHRGLQSRVA